MSDLKTRWAVVRIALKDQPTLVVTFVYCLASISGLAYSWVLFDRFGINFFDYAELTDLALAAFRSGFLTIWAIAGSCAVGAMMLWASGSRVGTFESKQVWGGVAFILLMPVAFGLSAGWQYANSIKLETAARVYLTSDSSARQFCDVAIIATAGDMTFVFDKGNNSAIAIPIAQIHHIVFAGSSAPPAPGDPCAARP